MEGPAVESGEPNPYEPSHLPAEAPARERGQREGVPISAFMIVAGAFFCVASFYAILGHGVEALLSSYRSLGWFPVAFMVFYGCAGGLTSLFHLLYLLRGWPQQHLAGVYAIVLALALAGLTVAIMELVV